MRLSDIKSQLEIPTFNLNYAQDAEGKETEWLRHWDNERRIAVSMHKDTVAKAKAEPGFASFGLQTEIRKGEKGEYTSYRVVAYNEADVTL